MSEIKRYDFERDITGAIECMSETPSGNWCKYSEVAESLVALERRARG